MILYIEKEMTERQTRVKILSATNFVGEINNYFVRSSFSSFRINRYLHLARLMAVILVFAFTDNFRNFRRFF